MLKMKIDSIRHKNKRTNIPTKELRDFVADEETSPSTLLYPRDLSLDPQLVWKGKDEQDSRDLSTPVVPIYIQEKILPKLLLIRYPVSNLLTIRSTFLMTLMEARMNSIRRSSFIITNRIGLTD